MSLRISLAATGAPLVEARRFTLPLGAHTLVVEPWSETVLAVRFETLAPLPESPAALPPELPLSALASDDVSGGWRLATRGVTLRVTASPLTLAWETPEGLPLWGPVAVATQSERLMLSGALLPQDACLGLGEKPGYLDRRGRRYTMWNTDNSGVHAETFDLLYQSIPFLVTRHEGRHAGFLFDDPGKAVFDLGAEDPAAWAYTADGPGLRLFAVAGPALADVVTGYGRLTGRMAMPPRWALGLHQSRWSYPSAEAVAEIAHEYRSRKIPADVIHLDIDYMDGYKVFTWHPERFADPAKLMADLAEQGFKAVTIVDPGVKEEPGYAAFDACLEKGLFVRHADGTPFIGKVWPGECLFPDFMREDTRAWWGAAHKAYLDVGVAGIWNDMNEPSVFKDADTPMPDRTMPESVRHGHVGAEVPHRKAHNLYGFQMSQATREGLLAHRPTKRPFVITRAGYAGVQRHAMVWTGDNHSMWSHLEMSVPMCLNLGLSGVAFTGPDVGGFMGDCTAELLVRWTQAGACFPFFRNHSAMGTRHQEPWAFGPDAERLTRSAIEWRYRLLPYLYGVFREAAETGLPIMRSMALAHPADPNCRALFDQYMLGGDLLVAPVVRPGVDTRTVYFPAGRWEHLLTGEVVEGPAFRMVDAPLDRLTLFVREGAALPLGPVVQHTGERVERVGLHLAPGETWAGTLYDDDGESLAYQSGAFNVWRVEGGLDAGAARLRLTAEASGYESPWRTLEVSVPWSGPVGPVRFEGEALEWRREGRRLVVAVPLRAGELTIARN